MSMGDAQWLLSGRHSGSCLVKWPLGTMLMAQLFRHCVFLPVPKRLPRGQPRRLAIYFLLPFAPNKSVLTGLFSSWLCVFSSESQGSQENPPERKQCEMISESLFTQFQGRDCRVSNLTRHCRISYSIISFFISFFFCLF